MRRRLLHIPLALTLLAAIVPAASALPAQKPLAARLSQIMAGTGGTSGAWVYDTDDDRLVFERRSRSPRSLASNQKLWTSGAAIARWGVDHQVQTVLYGTGVRDRDVWRGNLYLKGFGDPTLSTDAYAQRGLGDTSTRLSELADALAGSGISQVTGRVYGDEGYFDTKRGVPSSGYRTSFYVGPLSALALNAGYADLAGHIFQSSPASFVADRLTALLQDRGVEVSGKGAAGTTPADAQQLTLVQSPPLSELIRTMNKSSNNYFAEMLVKGLGASFAGEGSTRAGADVIEEFAHGQGLGVRALDGSGLARSDKASPRSVGMLLDKMHDRPDFNQFAGSLPIAGRDGTLKKRMRRGPARGRVHAKTGTLKGVSTLSGYVDTRSGDTLVFSILMNGVNIYTAHALQDRMAQAMAGS